MKLLLFLSLILSSTVHAETPGLLDRALPYLQYAAQMEKRFSTALSHCGPKVFENLKKEKFINLNDVSPICASELNWIYTEDYLSDNRDIKNLAIQITKSSRTRLEKIQAIHYWVTSNISYDVVKSQNLQKSIKAPEDRLISATRQTLETKAGICIDYSLLTAALLRAVDIPALVITGKAKVNDKMSAHVWNKAYLEDEGRWINMDTTLDAGSLEESEDGKFTFKRKSQSEQKYFDMNSSEFEKNHIAI